MTRRLIIPILLLFFLTPAAAQKINRLAPFRPMLDTLASHMRKRNTVKVTLSLSSVVKNGNSLDFHFKRTRCL